jgi:hypothetical protein
MARSRKVHRRTAGVVLVSAACGGAAGGACSFIEDTDGLAVADAGGADAANVEGAVDPDGFAVDAADDVVDELPPVPEDSGAPVCNGDPACERVVFVTSTAYNGGDIGGLTSADTKCQVVANASTHARVRGRVFKAWISNADTAAKDRLVASQRSYRLPSGAIIANDQADLLDGQIAHAIDETESGALLGSGNVWTGTYATGLPAGQAGAFCGVNWTNNSQNAHYGSVTETGNRWTNDDIAGCNTARHLYCFER